MKRVISTFLALFSVILLCSCDENNTGAVDNTTESVKEEKTMHNFDLDLTSTEYETNEKETVEQKTKDSVSGASEKVDDNIEITGYTTHKSEINGKTVKEYRKEYNGVILTVILPEKIGYGKDFTLVAKVLNNTGENISYTLPSITPNMHFEIKVKISNGNNSFTDRDTFNKPFEQLEKTAVLPDRETLEQAMTFLPGTTTANLINEENITMFDRGIYSGTAEFCWNVNGGTERILLEFPVEII